MRLYHEIEPRFRCSLQSRESHDYLQTPLNQFDDSERHKACWAFQVQIATADIEKVIWSKDLASLNTAADNRKRSQITGEHVHIDWQIKAMQSEPDIIGQCLVGPPPGDFSEQCLFHMRNDKGFSLGEISKINVCAQWARYLFLVIDRCPYRTFFSQLQFFRTKSFKNLSRDRCGLEIKNMHQLGALILELRVLHGFMSI
jgi:hypothetical protein